MHSRLIKSRSSSGMIDTDAAAVAVRRLLVITCDAVVTNIFNCHIFNPKRWIGLNSRSNHTATARDGERQCRAQKRTVQIATRWQKGAKLNLFKPVAMHAYYNTFSQASTHLSVRLYRFVHDHSNFRLRVNDERVVLAKQLPARHARDC